MQLKADTHQTSKGSRLTCDRYLVSEPVIQYIDEQGLYSPENGTPDTSPTPAPAPANAKVSTTDVD